MNLIHPQQLLEEERKAKQKPHLLKEYFENNPPILIDYRYHIDYTPELIDILIGIQPDFCVIEHVRSFIGVLANRDFIPSEFRYDVTYTINESYLTFILTPKKTYHTL